MKKFRVQHGICIWRFYSFDFYNIFETVVPSVQACVNPIKDAMCKQGAIRSMMSGSGPSVFGIFEDREKASAACEALRSMGADAFVCHPV